MVVGSGTAQAGVVVVLVAALAGAVVALGWLLLATLLDLLADTWPGRYRIVWMAAAAVVVFLLGPILAAA